MTLLLDNSLAPITHSIGFLRGNLETITSAFIDWRTKLYGSVNEVLLHGGITDNWKCLEPLTIAYVPRELIIQTTNPEWVAIFDSYASKNNSASSETAKPPLPSKAKTPTNASTPTCG
jgi:hypothetical protein